MGWKATDRVENIAEPDSAATEATTGSNVSHEKWQIEFAVTKRRVGTASEASAAPAGTSYHWSALAHQSADRNTDEHKTSMADMKFRHANERARPGKWSATPHAQRRHLINILQQVVDDLEREALSSEHVEGAKPLDGRLSRNGHAKHSRNGLAVRARDHATTPNGRANGANVANGKKPARTRHSRAA